jgi:hypothetical protein
MLDILDICDLIVCWDGLTSHLHVLGHDEFGRLMKVLVPVKLLNILQVVVACSVVVVLVLPYPELGRPMQSDALDTNFQHACQESIAFPYFLPYLSPASPKVESKVSRNSFTSAV